uniref:MYND-type domain-containing protein n=1 Tax=Anopheles maculatus TaxID=74869 RepID=A0A182T2V3_9DIPT
MVREIDAFFDNDFPYCILLKLRPDVKNNAKALVLRNLGNSLYNPMKLDAMSEALLYYNESIAHAAKGSETRAIAYGNRAAVCYHFQQYEDCLENVRLARASNYPDRLASKLKKREDEAKEAMEEKQFCEDEECCGSKAKNKKNPVFDELRLSYKANSNVPQMVECLQLNRNAKFGRQVVTDRALKVGDVVMIEQPYVTMVHEDFRHLRCAYCYDSNPFKLIPCEGCTMEMYCSEECLSQAHQQYHRYDCGIVRDLRRISDDVINGIDGLRTIAKVITTFGHDLDALKKHLDGLDESKVNAFTMDWNTATPTDIYNTVHVLSANDALRDRKEMARQVFHSTIVHRLMLERTELGA